MPIDISWLSTPCASDKPSSPSTDMSDDELKQSFSVLDIPIVISTSSPKSVVSKHLSSYLSDDTVVISLKHNSDNDVMKVTNVSNKVEHPFQNSSQYGVNWSFLCVNKAFRIVQTQTPIGPYIPLSIKENVFVLIDHTYNIVNVICPKVNTPITTAPEIVKRTLEQL